MIHDNRLAHDLVVDVSAVASFLVGCRVPGLHETKTVYLFLLV